MAKKKKVVRTPIILNPDVEYHTIVATNKYYENATSMGVYPTIDLAKQNYQADMDKWGRENGKGHWHFAIRRVKKEKEKHDDME